jgi:hypothetical protein
VRAFLPALLLMSLLAACGGGDDTPADAGPSTLDAGEADAGPVDAGPPTPVSNPTLATDVAVGEVSLYQAVKVSLSADGTPVARTAAPVIIGRDAVFRVGVAPAADFVPRELGCEVIIDPGNGALRSFTGQQMIHGASSDADASSFCTVTVPGANFSERARWAVRLIDPAAPAVEGSAPSSARIPADGSTASLGARGDAGGIQVTLVPVRWNADGSGRLPDTSDAQIARYKALLLALYPVTRVDLTVHAPVDYSGALLASGDADFADVNTVLQTVRQADGAPREAYYYGLLSPTSSFGQYCQGSCTTGQGYVVQGAGDGDFRVGSGIGFSGDDSAWTLVHELGHEAGRMHAPCSAGNTDPNFPYADGSIGVWGLDDRSGAYLSPSENADFMSYCNPNWTSDYTYSAIFDRQLAVHGAAPRALERPQGYRFLALDAGGLRWRRPVTLSRAPTGDGATWPATWLDARGRVLRTDAVARLALGEAEAVEYALPLPPAGARSVRVAGLTAAVP